MFEYTCPVCGNVKKVRYKKDVRTFCSIRCSAQHRSNLKVLEDLGECIFQPESIVCSERNCGNCGWNPVVAKARLEAFKEKYNVQIDSSV